MGLPKELWEQISTDNPTTYYKLLQVSKIFKLDTDLMKSKFIRKTEGCGKIRYRLPNGWLHSCNDKPAKIWINRGKAWYINGELHRDNDNPAVIRDGDRCWYINGKHHRDNDLPAEIWPCGTQVWCIDGKKHRDNDQPAVIWANGNPEWYINDKRYIP